MMTYRPQQRHGGRGVSKALRLFCAWQFRLLAQALAQAVEGEADADGAGLHQLAWIIDEERWNSQLAVRPVEARSSLEERNLIYNALYLPLQIRSRPLAPPLPMRRT